MDSIVQCQFRPAQQFYLLVEIWEALGQVVRNRWLSNKAEIERVWTRHRRPQRLVPQLVVLPRVPAVFIPQVLAVSIPRVPAVSIPQAPVVLALGVAVAAQGKRSTKSSHTV